MSIEGKLLGRIEIKATGTKEGKIHFESSMLSAGGAVVVGMLVHCLEVTSQQLHADPVKLAFSAALMAKENLAAGGRKSVEMKWPYGGIDA